MTHAELHDLCQPLTALQCQLEMNTIRRGDDSAEQVIRGALEETRRIFAVIERMRSRLEQIERWSEGAPEQAGKRNERRPVSQ